MSCGCSFIDQDLLQKFPVFREQRIDGIMCGRGGKKSLQALQLDFLLVFLILINIDKINYQFK